MRRQVFDIEVVELADVLRSAFAMFPLKSHSLLAFKELTKQEEKKPQGVATTP